MRSRFFDRLMAVNAWIACVYAFFSAISLFQAPDYLLVTQRHEYVFDHIAGREWFGLIYLLIGAVSAAAVSHLKYRTVAFGLMSIVSFFWASVGIVPALTGVVPQGNLLGTISGVTLGAFTITMSILCFNEYNRKQPLS